MKSQDTSSEDKIRVYKCPIYCELGKEYYEPGICPVCDMTLVSEDEINQNSIVNVVK